MKMQTYKALIIGCGRIAGFSDENSSTHAGAILRSKEVRLVACVDRSLFKAEQFANRYKCNFFDNLKSALQNSNADIVSICTPDETHFGVAKSVLTSGYPPRIIFLEKPACLFDYEYAELKELARAFGVLIVVNHTRRFNSSYSSLRELIRSNDLGSLYRLNAIYYGGWFHNGVHLVDTISYLLEDQVEWLKVDDVIPSQRKYDPALELTGKLTKNGAKVSLAAIDESIYQIFDMDLWFYQGRLRIEDFGNHILLEKQTINSINESVLQRVSLKLPNCQISEMEVAYSQIGKYLNQEDKQILDLVSLEGISLTMRSLWQGASLYKG